MLTTANIATNRCKWVKITFSTMVLHSWQWFNHYWMKHGSPLQSHWSNFHSDVLSYLNHVIDWLSRLGHIQLAPKTAWNARTIEWECDLGRVRIRDLHRPFRETLLPIHCESLWHRDPSIWKWDLQWKIPAHARQYQPTSYTGYCIIERISYSYHNDLWIKYL